MLDSAQEEYGGPPPFNQWMRLTCPLACSPRRSRHWKTSTSCGKGAKRPWKMVPVGVDLILPGNSDAFFICDKLASASAAG